jgi:hypothetical protein
VNAPSILPARFDWPSLIGNFLLNFGTLEHSVFVYLKDRLPSDEYLRVREWHLKNRLERIARHLNETHATEDQKAGFADMVKRLDPVRELRNCLAHGHLFVTIDEETFKPSVTLMMAKDLDMQDSPDCRQLPYQELLAARSELVEVIEAFQSLAGFSVSGTFTLPSGVELDKNVGRLLCLPPDALKQLQKEVEEMKVASQLGQKRGLAAGLSSTSPNTNGPDALENHDPV